MKKILLIISVAMISLGTVSCKKYLDINTDPNSPDPEQIEPGMILPGAEVALMTSYGDFYRILGGYFSQQFSQMFGTSNYLSYSQFEMLPTKSNTHYTQLYQKVLVNCKNIMEKADAEGNAAVNLQAAAYSAFAYQILVDCFGEVPYTEALDATNLAPKYDDGLTVYKGILSVLDGAITLAKEKGGIPATSLLYPGGTAADWIKFANTVKLKILMRMSNQADAATELSALIAENNFITSDAEFAGCFKNEEQQASPLYSEEYATWHSQSNVIGNVAYINTMLQTDAEGTVVYTDGRLAKFYTTNNSGNFVGGISGTNFGTTAPSPYNNAAGFSRPDIKFDTPVSLISLAEVEFFKAEYYAKNGGDAESHYEAAVEASFSSAGADGADDFLGLYPYDAANYKECIGIAKWLALGGINNFESWCEVRRLKYPAFGNVKGSDMWNGSNAVDVSIYEAGTLYTPYQVFAQVGENNLIARWPYPESSTSRNANSPAFKGYTTPVFWAE